MNNINSKEVTDSYIKYLCNFTYDTNISNPDINKFNHLRSILLELRLIGTYPDGVSYGNLSQKQKNNAVIITGTNTGSKTTLTPLDFSCIYDYSINDNFVTCKGGKRASSESLTHLAIYENSSAEVVVHIHSLRLWEKLIHIYPSSSPEAKFGTVELANEFKDLIQKYEMTSSGVIISGGHKEGIFLFDVSFENVYTLLSRIIDFK